MLKVCYNMREMAVLYGLFLILRRSRFACELSILYNQLLCNQWKLKGD